MKIDFRSWMFRIWYWYISKIDKKAEVVFMNYGYHDANENIPLSAADEANRYPIQLYHRLARTVDLNGKSIVEVGCGRGGGLDYICRTFKPKTALGIDLNERAAKFANQHFKQDGLAYRQGDAQNLPLENHSFDVVLNVESSHRYPEMDRFLAEVSRVLKPGGHFLFTDFRYPHEMPQLEKQLEALGFKLTEKQKINPNVLLALEKDNQRREELIKKLTPFFLHKVARDFSGTTGSLTYNQIAREEYIYFLYVFARA